MGLTFCAKVLNNPFRKKIEVKIKFVASIVAALSLAFIPTMAQAVVTTLDIQNGLSSAVDLESGDTLDVTVAGPIAKTGPAVHELYSTWSAQSLALVMDDSDSPEDDITWPEGWNLEYTLDGTTWIDWAVTEPTDVADIIAIRSIGDVNTVGENIFKTTADGQLYTQPFSGGGGGDGYDVAVGNGKVLNVYHHTDNTVTFSCHYYDGTACAEDFGIDGYSNNYASRVFFDESNNHAYTFVMRDNDGSYGVLCANYADVANIASCGYTMLNDTQDSLDQYDLGSASQQGTKLWSIQGTSGLLMCFNMSTAAACATGDGFNTTYAASSEQYARVTAAGQYVFFTSGDRLGCFNTVSVALCGAGVALSEDTNRSAPFPIEDNTGALVGACDEENRVCVNLTGGSLTIPASLNTFWNAFPVDDDNPGQNMSQFGYGEHRIFSGTSVGQGAMGSWAPNNISCYDFLTSSACVGWDGGARDGIVQMYTATVDSSTPGCVWINTHAGNIVPLDSTTGRPGCDLGEPTVELPYDAVVPRMSCAEEGRVIEWRSLTVAVPTGVAMSAVRVTIYDSENNLVTGFVDLTPNASGYVDLTGLTVDDTGTQPTIRITAGDIANSLANQIAGTVQFVAEDPELCFALDASNHCETTVSPDPPAGSIADGIVEGTSITRPNTGSDVGSKQTITLPGASASDMCQASGLRIPLPGSQLASTGVDAGAFAMTGFAVLAVGGVAVAATRRRKA